MSKGDRAECRVVLGVAHLYAGNYGDVVRVLGEGEREEERIPRIFKEIVFRTRGVAHLRLGQSQSGLADVNRALVTNPDCYKVHTQWRGISTISMM